jgi:hypothetical protein
MATDLAFLEFPKMARLTRECVITEKIDGTNAQVFIVDADNFDHALPMPPWSARVGTLMIAAGSRTRYITSSDDNFGFAKWVEAHAEELAVLGEGRHYGEWWGSGIQRNYGLTEKRFSLFNVSRWHAAGAEPYITEPADPRQAPKSSTEVPACCYVVPILYRGLFGPKHDDNYIAKLQHEGSVAAPGFMKPEGVVVYHVAAGVSFKKTLEKDEQPKSLHR